MNNTTQYHEQLIKFGNLITENGKQADEAKNISHKNYDILKEMKFFSGLVPKELGGGNLTFAQMCDLLKKLAHFHPSTALSVSMHQHIISANIYNHKHNKPGQAVLEKVAKNELVLISTGAGDWLASNGELTKTEGGFYLTATKHFASGCQQGDVLITSAPYKDKEAGWQVLHFPVPINTMGLKILDNWHPMGMRGTGSNSIQFENVFIPEASIALKRSRGDFHAIWCTVLPVALPLIMSVYLGIAETAATKAKLQCKASLDPTTPYILGEMENALITAQIVVNDMVRICDEFNFSATQQTVNEMIKRKTVAATHCKRVALKAIEACGGPGYLSFLGLECLLRDVMASHFHPMQEKRQLLFTGMLAMDKEPPSQIF